MEELVKKALEEADCIFNILSKKQKDWIMSQSFLQFNTDGENTVVGLIKSFTEDTLTNEDPTNHAKFMLSTHYTKYEYDDVDVYVASLGKKTEAGKNILSVMMDISNYKTHTALEEIDLIREICDDLDLAYEYFSLATYIDLFTHLVKNKDATMSDDYILWITKCNLLSDLLTYGLCTLQNTDDFKTIKISSDKPIKLMSLTGNISVQEFNNVHYAILNNGLVFDPFGLNTSIKVSKYMNMVKDLNKNVEFSVEDR